MPWTLYRSDDAGAPVLNGTAGSLIAVLDAILLNGYGDKPALGWEKAFSGTNKAAYRALTGNRHYLRVDDTGTTSARVVGYESMTGVDTGEYPFPTNAQVSGGLYVPKSNAADSTSRVWLCFGNEKTAYLFTFGHSSSSMTNIASGIAAGGVWFGEAKSYVPNDAYATFLCADISFSTNGNNSRIAILGTTGKYMARRMDGAPGSENFITAQWSYSISAIQTIGAEIGLDAYPNPLTGRVSFSPLLVSGGIPDTSRRLVRAEFPRLFAPLSYLPGNHLDVIEGQGELEGKNLLLVKAYNSSGEGRLALQISGDDL